MRFCLYGALSVVGLSVTACGGGGGAGGGVSSLNLPLLADPEDFETSEYGNSTGLDQIGASFLYAAGGTGDGITVAVIDTGIDTDHPELQGAITANSRNIVAGNGDIEDASGHGTLVAGVIAARRNGTATHGVAPEASILALRADAVGTCPGACAFEQSDIAKATDYATANGADIINYSLGSADSLAVSAQQAFARAVDANKLLVFAAGNDGEADPTYPGRFAASSDADGKAIVVGAVNASNVMASFSNRAGVARDSFLVAPGVNIRTTKNGGGTQLADGTSMAAPFVSGAAAALWQAAPHLSATQVRTLLLTTAKDLGAAGTDAVYGRGLLDLKNALQPQGTSIVPTGNTVAQGGANVSRSALALGPAFAGGFSGDALDSVMMLDGFGRAYSIDLGKQIEAGRQATRLDHWIASRPGRMVGQQFGDGLAWQAHLSENDPISDRQESTSQDLDAFRFDLDFGTRSRISATHGSDAAYVMQQAGEVPDSGSLAGNGFARPYLGLVSGTGLMLEHGLGGGFSGRFAFFTDDDFAEPGGSPLERSAYLFELSRSFDRDGVVNIQIGQLHESGGPLGSSGSGALSLGDESSTSFASVGTSLSLTPALRLFGRAGFGVTRVEQSGGLIESVPAFWSTSAAIGLQQTQLIVPSDHLTLVVRQPLKAENAQADLRVPVGRTVSGAVLHENRRVALSGSDREVNFEMTYGRAIREQGALATSLLLRVAPDHDANRAPELIAAVRYRHRF